MAGLSELDDIDNQWPFHDIDRYDVNDYQW